MPPSPTRPCSAYSILVPGSGGTATPPLAPLAPLGLTGPVPRSAGCGIVEPVIEFPSMGALFTEPPRSAADAVRAGGADCIGAEFIAELPVGAAIEVAAEVVGPLK